MILSDRHIRKLCLPSPEALYLGMDVGVRIEPLDGRPLIEPFSEAVSGNGAVSSGLTTSGYDLTLASTILRFRPECGEVIDPKRFGDENYRRRVFDECDYKDGARVVIPPGHYLLGMTREYIRMPRRLKGRVVGKSTLARCLIHINCTPIEPGWHGAITLEIGNNGHLPACVYAGEGIAQLEFDVLSSDPTTSYGEKAGKYQGQTGVTPALVL